MSDEFSIRRVLGNLLMATGAFIAGVAGLVTATIELIFFIQTAASAVFSDIDEPTVQGWIPLAVGFLPILIGVLIYRLGRWLVRTARPVPLLEVRPRA